MKNSDGKQKRINEDTPVGQPYSVDIPCKTCAFRLKPIGEFERYNNAYCEIYTPKTNGKPSEVLFQNADCKYYVKDE